ncbi:MAG: glutamine-hydrolyzing carbamoyl-phosphate synthase small subunit [Armatimonadetes bacterium]|nr:glutamine-hydrolyzing carbamoyl-phosphate synthase small subunit [Armatimonadota bacterium]
MKAIFATEDGTFFEGESIGAAGTSVGEVVFSTAMAGYQEMLSDPSFGGQLLTLTYPLIGNYGVTPEDMESERVQVAGFIIHNLCEAPSNWRSSGTLTELLRANRVVAVSGIDTRAVTRHIRTAGEMMGALSTEHTREELLSLLRSSPRYEEINYVEKASAPGRYVFPAATQTKKRVALLDYGVKRNILRELSKLGCETTVYPYATSAREILEAGPDGVVISPGPGDPERLLSVVEDVKTLAESGTPLMGICLGHQTLGRAYGAKTYKMPFGHRGGNHPVKDLASGRVYITSQNHGYAVDPDGLAGSDMEIAQINLNDGTVEGLRHRTRPVFSIQYHPEASPGPVDSNYFFHQFMKMMGES